MARRKPMTPEETMEPVAPAPVTSDPDMAEALVTPTQKTKSKTALTLGLGMFLGAGIAALGYGAALKYPLLPAAMPSADAGALADLSAKVDGIDAANLQARIAALEAAPVAVVDTTALEARITAIEATLAAAPQNNDVRAELADIRAKLAQSDPTPAIKAAIAAQMSSVEKAAQDMVSKVSDAANQAAQLSAMTLLQAALDTGAPYASAAAQIALPEVLATHAETGIPSLTQLRGSFPDAARAGLEAALKDNMGETWRERITNFLRSQTGARTLTPREGNDPDAILSRVDAALTAADMPAVIAEIASLPEASKTAMQPWIDLAKLRADALAAFSSLTKGGM